MLPTSKYRADHNATDNIGALKPESIRIYKKLGAGIIVGIEAYFERPPDGCLPTDVEFILYEKLFSKSNLLEFSTISAYGITGQRINRDPWKSIYVVIDREVNNKITRYTIIWIVDIKANECIGFCREHFK